MESFLRISPRVSDKREDAERQDEPNELRRWVIQIPNCYGRVLWPGFIFPRLGLISAWRVGFFHQSAAQFVIQRSRRGLAVFPGWGDCRGLLSSGFQFSLDIVFVVAGAQSWME
jgi:hypothetical protein